MDAPPADEAPADIEDDVPCVPIIEAAESSEISSQLRIGTYNIYDGLKFQDAVRVQKCQQWLAAQQLDVVGLNEANGFTADSLKEFGAKIGFAHTFLLPLKSTYHLGLLSRYPIAVADTSSLWLFHGLLHAKVPLRRNEEVQTLHVLVTHLTPEDAAARRIEVQTIIDYARGFAGEPLVLMGDLNSLSSADADERIHNHAGLLGLLISQPKRRRKFLDAEGRIDYEPIDMLYREGFVDAGRSIGEPGADSVDSTTVNTSVNEASANAEEMRLDYIMLNPALAQRLGGNAAITVRDELTHDISDHFPVVLTLDL